MIRIISDQEVEFHIVLFRRQDALLKFWAILPHKLRRLVHDHPYVRRRDDHSHVLSVGFQSDFASPIDLYSSIAYTRINARRSEFHRGLGTLAIPRSAWCPVHWKIDPLGETEVPGSTREGLGLGMTNHEPTNSTQRKKRGVFFVFSE